jgi:hypothetical protein
MADGCEAMKRLSHIQEALNKLETAVSHGEQLLEKIESKYSPILRGRVPEPLKEKPKEAMITVPLASNISSLAERICAVNEGIENVLARTEL